MSQQLARSVAGRLNLQPIMMSLAHAELVADGLRSLASANSKEEESAEDVRRRELMSAYGFNGESSDKKPFAYAEGIAFIPVHGMLINRFPYSWGWVTGYNFIRSQLNAAIDDPDVKGIVFDVNSSGGEVAGCFELCDDIFEARKKKSCIAVVDSMCYSAAYAIGSSAEKVILAPSSGAGSIGVVSMHISWEKALNDFGIKVTFIHSGDHKVDGNMFQDLPKAVKADIQTRVDKTRSKFAGLVARNRSIDTKAVRDTEARCYDAEDAVELGLADSIATPQVAVVEFITELSGSKPDDEDQTMSKPDQAAASGAESTAATQEQTNPQQNAGAVANTEDHRAAERQRIDAIMNCDEAKERPTLAKHLALKTQMSADEAKSVLTVSPKEGAQQASASAFEMAMNADRHPQVGADLGASADGQNGEDAAARILRAQAAFTGVAHAKQ